MLNDVLRKQSVISLGTMSSSKNLWLNLKLLVFHVENVLKDVTFEPRIEYKVGRLSIQKLWLNTCSLRVE